MSSLLFVPVITAIFALWLLAAWLDHSKGWQLTAWFSGKVENPFTPSAEQVDTGIAAIRKKDKTIADLQQRIEVLERIVTEPAYELNQKINQL